VKRAVGDYIYRMDMKVSTVQEIMKKLQNAFGLKDDCTMLFAPLGSEAYKRFPKHMSELPEHIQVVLVE
jgi:hypothetical protein